MKSGFPSSDVSMAVVPMGILRNVSDIMNSIVHDAERSSRIVVLNPYVQMHLEHHSL
jgi:hypothetical protein